jgi:nucleoside 2-deoxyribosyltransferase
MKKVYLSGAIFQAADSKSWRQIASARLPKGWEAVDPTAFEVGHLTCTELVKLDLQQLDACNAVIVRADQPSWGTAMEIFYAQQKGVPVLAWPCFLERAPWLTAHVTEFFGSLNEAVEGLKNYA